MNGNELMLWGLAMVALERAQGEVCSNDDVAMQFASDDELRRWTDDLQDRVGLNVAEFRRRIDSYIAERAA